MTDTAQRKKNIMNSGDISRTLSRIAYEILEQNQGVESLAIVGIVARGNTLAKRLAKLICDTEKCGSVPVGAIDITLYRDDVGEIGIKPIVHETRIDFDVTGKTIILVDDVLFTGRTVRCALDVLMDYGRPKRIVLAVLVDRGHRELPIRADYVGRELKTTREQQVIVRLKEDDGADEVVVVDKK